MATLREILRLLSHKLKKFGLMQNKRRLRALTATLFRVNLLSHPQAQRVLARITWGLARTRTSI